MLEKHLRRIKKSESGVAQEDEWEEIPTLGQKMEDRFIEEVPERTVIIEQTNKTNLEAFDEDSPKIKDAFHNAAQYVKLIKNHVQEKKSEFEKFKQDKVKFDKDVSTLRPRQPEINFDLGKLDYKEVKVRQLKQELNILEEERELIRNNITHFNNQINQAQSELSFKVEQIDEIQMDIREQENSKNGIDEQIEMTERMEIEGQNSIGVQTRPSQANRSVPSEEGLKINDETLLATTINEFGSTNDSRTNWLSR